MHESDKEFTLTLDTAPAAKIYLSVSWKPDQGKDFGTRLVRKLDEKLVQAVGDPKGFDEMDTARLDRVMSGTTGFLSVLPFRPDAPSKTSGFMLEEMRIATAHSFPIAIVYDKRIGLKTKKTADGTELTFKDGATVVLPENEASWVKSFDFGVEKSEETTLVELSDFLESVKTPASRNPEFAFLITRLQLDFKLPRHACLTAVEQATGLPCIWIDSPNYATNVEDTIERARLLTKHAQFVVAEISLTDEDTNLDNPSRAHEIGLATAFGKPVYAVSHDPRRHPYHALVSRQLIWWSSEAELHEELCERLHVDRAEIGRHVYNTDLLEADSSYEAKQVPATFDPEHAPPWQPPRSGDLEPWLSWVYAASFAVLAFCAAILLRIFSGYDDTLDLVAILAGLIALLFSSTVNKRIQRTLATTGFLRWLVPLIAAAVLVTTLIVTRPPTPNEAEQGAAEQPATPP